MAVLTPGGAAAPAPARRVLLACDEEQLDSTLALRRVTAHLGDLFPVGPASDGAPFDGPPPDAALVCDDDAATARLLELGVPVVHLQSGHRVLPAGATADAAAGTADRALRRLHRPGWLPGPWSPAAGARPTGALAPVRLTRNRVRAGALLLLSARGVPEREADAFAAGPLRALVRAAVARTGRCEVVCDTGLAAVRCALDGLADGVRVSRAAEVDVDALHAAADVFVAAPTLGALALAQARRAPLVFLPPLGSAQRELAERVAQVVPVPLATDPGDPSLWVPPEAGGAGQWNALDPGLDDLRGAQRVARTLRQLSLAPL
ncbi:CGA synthase-related protein [Kitasatospora sp. NPDC056138]|uniref:CGA synthase-related protein n=1 Tax=Kitasatospora sp. NPDC056138 TaxID=3345724 RepID=UPI0035E0FDAC